MWKRNRSVSGENPKFFVGVVSESTLSSLYQLYHNLKYFGNYSIFEIDSMIPFERDIYMGLLSKTIEEKKNNAKKAR